MNKQEIFDKSVGGIIAQGEYAIQMIPAQGVRCLYRTNTGKACAAGQLIEDHEYDPEMENRPFWSVLDRFPSLARYNAFSKFISELQEAHDNSSCSTDGLNRFIAECKKIADTHQLKWNF